MNGSQKRWLGRAFLAASLALNVSLGWLLLRPPAEPVSAPAIASSGPLATLRRVAAQLPEAERVALTEATMSRGMSMRAAQQRYEEQAKHVLELLAAESLDVEALRSEIMKARASRQEVVDELLAAFLEVLPRLSVESRRLLAEHGTHAKIAKSGR